MGVVNFGCRLNIAEGEAMAAALPADTVLINSCAVTAEAERQAVKAIRRARREQPEARIVVTGCAATIAPDRFRALAEVDAVLPNAAKPPVTGRAARTRSFIPVQNGCDHSCTFCIIPQGRGPSRSEPTATVIERIRTAVEGGAREVVLTGVDVTSWNAEGSFGDLVAAILAAVPTLPRLRLSSLDAVELDARLIDLIAHEPRVMPHLHLSLQHGHDLILKRMKRRHTRGQAIALVERLKAKRPEIAIGADLIAGFPTESEAMHRDNLSLLDAADVVHAHIFPYSPRPGTPAGRMPQLEREVIAARARELRVAAAARHERWLDGLVGTTQPVLVEQGGKGHAPNFAVVAPIGPTLRQAQGERSALGDARTTGAHPEPVEGWAPGTILTARILSRDGTNLIGTPA